MKWPRSRHVRLIISWQRRTATRSPRTTRTRHRDALAVGGTHAGDASRLPIGLPEHMPDGRNLLHHGLIDPILVERIAVTARAQEPLRKESRPAFDAAPDCNAPIHSRRSNTAAAAVPP